MRKRIEAALGVPPAHPPARAPGSVRLVTYNIHSCIGRDGQARPERVADVLRDLAPDIVALQEVEVGMARTGGFDQAAEIARLLDMDEFEFHPAMHRGGGEFGVAILSRYPMETVRAETLPLARLRLMQPRVALAVRVHTRAGAVQVVNTHLGLIGEERRRQIEALVGPHWLGALVERGATVLCGDLNARPESAECRRLRTCLRDALGDGDRMRSFPATFPLVRLDHVLISPHLESAAASVLRSPLTLVASDHCPVLADLRLRG